MTNEIKQRIEQIKKGEIPDGYRYTRAGICPSDWDIGFLSDVLYNEQRTVKKPEEAYWRLGIRSHAKGTFHEFVENPETVDMDELYVVRENDLVVNITFAWEHAVALADKNDDGLLVSHRFPTYVFKEGQNPIFYKSVVIQKRFKELLALISPGGAGRNRVMSKKDFLRLPCNIPPLAEQIKIAEILMQCNRIIELRQKLIEQTKKLKKAYLRKMFPQKDENVPEIRFPGFTAPWEQRKITEFVEFYNGLTYSPNDVRESGTLVLRSSNVQNGEIVDADNVYVDPEKATSEKVKDGDIIVVIRNGSRALIGKHAEIKGNKPNTVIGAFMAGIRSERSSFVNALLDTNQFEKEIEKNMGATINQITGYMFSKMEFMIPSYEEQEEIGTYFRNLDNLITLHQRELQEWQNKKKALMQLLLTGIVRAKND